MIIQGHYIADAPYIGAHIQIKRFNGVVWFLVDTGATRTTLLDRDVQQLGLTQKVLQPSQIPMMGIGGSVRSFILKDVKLTFASNEGDFVLDEDIFVAQHDLLLLPHDEKARILRLPSVLGRDIINRFRLISNYQTGEFILER